MRKFAVTSDRWEGAMTFEYHDNEWLACCSVPEVINQKALEWFSTHHPVHIQILDWVANNAPVKVAEILEPVDFETFWELYDKKTGSKDNARSYWDGEKKTVSKRPVNEIDRMDIMRILKKYVAKYRGEQKVFQPLVTTFLHQRHWVAELEAMAKIQEKATSVDSLLAKFNTK